MVIIYFALFVVLTGIHLYGSYKQQKSIRAATKPLILLTILGMYLEWCHSFRSDPSIFVVLALLTSWLGDVLLIPSGIKWFTAGGISFWISHFFFILAYYESGVIFSQIPLWLILLICVIYCAAAVFIFEKLKKSLPKALFYPMFFYFLTNGAMNAFAWFRLLSGSCTVLSGLVTAIGAVLFFLSDAALFFVRFDKNSRVKTHFLVMLLYSIGEFLIAFGLMLLKI